jgi:hypothetical protein
MRIGLKIVILTLVGCDALADLPKDPSEYAAWQAKMLEGIHLQSGLPESESIPKLSQWIRQLSLPYNQEQGERPVFHAAQSAILLIPGHAEYHADRIKEAQRKFERLTPNDSEYGYLQSQLLNEQMYGFETLQYLPSPETVRVLGEFLFDPWGLDPNAKPGEKYGKDEQGQTPHAGRALRALAHLPLETRANATPAEKTQYWNDIDAWKLWYEQVRAGTRTFRFKGNPQNYSLAGPVPVAIEPAARPAPVSSTDAEAVLEPDDHGSRMKVIAPLVIATALLAWALWQVKRTRAGRA